MNEAFVFQDFYGRVFKAEPAKHGDNWWILAWHAIQGRWIKLRMTDAKYVREWVARAMPLVDAEDYERLHNQFNQR